MANEIKKCPECGKEVKQIMKERGLCRGCNIKAVAAEKAAAKKAPTSQAEGTAAPVESKGTDEETVERGHPTRRKRKSLEDRRSYSADPMAKDPNYAYYIAKEDPRKPGRVQELEAAGYSVVTQRDNVDELTLSELSIDSRGLGSVVSKPAGNGAEGILMRRPKDIDDEDRAFVQDKAARREQGIFGTPGETQQYRPKAVPVEVGSGLYHTQKE
jgi:DNA-directed RNA polymerase subunit RPC12/RpoP